MTKAYSYIRFSSPEQAKGRSYDRQRERCVEYCQKHGLTLASGSDYTFFDRGRSAYKGTHLGKDGQLARFIALVEDGTIEAGSTLIVESLDRLDRQDIWIALPMFMSLISAGIRVVTLVDGQVYTKDGGAKDLILSIFVLSRGNDESVNKSSRIADAWSAKRESARKALTPIGAAVPMWLDFVRADDIAEQKEAIRKGEYRENKERCDVVRRIFALAIAGYGKAITARMLNEENAASFKKTTWGSSSVDKVLRNKAVMGYYQPMHGGKPFGEPVEGYFPVVVEPTLFYQAQEATQGRLIARATKQTKNYQIWQGIAICLLCQKPLHYVNKGLPPRGRTYLICSDKRKGVCKAKHIRYDIAESGFRELLTKVDSLALVRDSSGKIERELREVSGKLIEQRRMLEKHKAAAKIYTEDDTIYGLLAAAGAEVRQLVKRQDELSVLLAADRIIDKEKFFERLDLITYEGRERANSLLKRLKIKVAIEEDRYIVMQDESVILGMRVTEDGVDVTPFKQEQADTIRMQKDESALSIVGTLMLEDMDTFVEVVKRIHDRSTS